jgi:hypothetical protein
MNKVSSNYQPTHAANGIETPEDGVLHNPLLTEFFQVGTYRKQLQKHTQQILALP